MIHKIWKNYADVEQNITLVKNTLLTSFKVPMPEINAKLAEYVNAPGKYLRSGLVFLVAKSLKMKADESLIKAASAIELLHLATLIHDDVIDRAQTRRGVLAFHEQYSNRIAIYSGDYALLVSGRLLAESEIRNKEVVFDKNLLDHILVGELRQLMNQNRPGMSFMDYLRQIKGKTATLFGMATMLSGVKANLTRKEVKRLFYAGQMIGMAFQLRDDLIDYREDVKESGKPRLQDIQNGIYTAPYLLLKQKVSNLNQLNEEELLLLMEKHDIYKEVERLIEAYLEKAWHYFSLLNLDYDEIKSLINRLNN